MTGSTFFLRFAAPVQSWGRYRVNGNQTPTYMTPSKSAVTGILGAATGMHEKFQPSMFTMEVRVDKQESVVSEVQTGGPFNTQETVLHMTQQRLVAPEKVPVKGLEKQGLKRFITKDVLPRCEYIVSVHVPDTETAEKVAAGLDAPVHPLSLGKRPYIPSFPFYLGHVEGEHHRLLSDIPHLRHPHVQYFTDTLTVYRVDGDYHNETRTARAVTPPSGGRSDVLAWAKTNLSQEIIREQSQR